jgi:hypothetical protein
MPWRCLSGSPRSSGRLDASPSGPLNGDTIPEPTALETAPKRRDHRAEVRQLRLILRRHRTLARAASGTLTRVETPRLASPLALRQVRNM